MNNKFIDEIYKILKLYNNKCKHENNILIKYKKYFGYQL